MEIDKALLVSTATLRQKA